MIFPYLEGFRAGTSYGEQLVIAEKTILFLYFWSILISSISMLVSGYYTGELEGFFVNISKIELVGLISLQLIGFFFLYNIYKISKTQRFCIRGYKLKINTRRFFVFFVVICLVNIVFVVRTGVGVVNSEAKSSVSFLFAIINPDYLFPLYYVIGKEYYIRKKQASCKLFFYAGVIIYSILEFSQGWTGFLLVVSFIELFFYFRFRNKSIIQRFIVPIILPVFLILLGGKAYQYLYQYKNEVRGNEISSLSYREGVTKLISRMTNLPLAVGSLEKIDEIKNLYVSDPIKYKELRGFFRPILPSIITGTKEYRPINNHAVQAFYPELKNNTSSDLGLVSYSLVLLNADILEWSVWLLASILLILFFKIIFSLVERYPGQLDVLFFLLLTRYYNSASLETTFGYGFVGLLYIILVMICFRVIVIKRLSFACRSY